jgi:hypothetical protein
MGGLKGFVNFFVFFFVYVFFLTPFWVVVVLVFGEGSFPVFPLFFYFLFFFIEVVFFEYLFLTHLGTQFSLFNFADIPSIPTQLPFKYWFFLHPTVVLRFGLFDNNVADIIVFLDVGVEPVFDLVFWTTGEFLADFRPPTTQHRVVVEDEVVFLVCPVLRFDLWVQFVNETLSDLLACLGTHDLGEQLPVLADFLDEG